MILLRLVQMQPNATLWRHTWNFSFFCYRTNARTVLRVWVEEIDI